MRLGSGICFLIITAGSATAATPMGTVGMDVVQGRPVVKGVYLNGQGPFRFLLDTGAQSNQLEAGLANKLKVTSSFRVELATAAGSQVVPGGFVGMVQLGEAQAGQQEFLFTNLSGVHSLAKNIDGVLGQEFLAKFDYLLDFHNKKIEFGKRDFPGVRLTVKSKSGSMVVPTSEGGLILDSGTDALILFRGGTRRGHARITTASGFAAASEGGPSRIRIGEREYRPQSTALASAYGREAGLLPASLFRALYICNSENYIIPE